MTNNDIVTKQSSLVTNDNSSNDKINQNKSCPTNMNNKSYPGLQNKSKVKINRNSSEELSSGTINRRPTMTMRSNSMKDDKVQVPGDDQSLRIKYIW